jgi:hypothetical protein
LTIESVLAVLALFRIVFDFALDAARMRKIQNDERLNPIGMRHGQGPCHRATPVMTDNHGAGSALGLDHRTDIVDQQGHRILFDAGGTTRQVVAPLIHGHDAVVSAERVHLFAPCIPEVRKAMDHHDQRTLADRNIVNFYAVRIRVVLLDPIP